MLLLLPGTWAPDRRCRIFLDPEQHLTSRRLHATHGEQHLTSPGADVADGACCWCSWCLLLLVLAAGADGACCWCSWCLLLVLLVLAAGATSADGACCRCWWCLLLLAAACYCCWLLAASCLLLAAWCCLLLAVLPMVSWCIWCIWRNNCVCAMVLSWWIVFLVYLCHILVQGSTELPIIAEMLIHFRFGENGALICT